MILNVHTFPIYKGLYIVLFVIFAVDKLNKYKTFPKANGAFDRDSFIDLNKES